jgi:hypothetical protein
MGTRYFAVVRVVTDSGTVIAQRDDDVGRLFLDAVEAEKAGALVPGDRIEVGIAPGGVGVDPLLIARRARVLAAAQ